MSNLGGGDTPFDSPNSRDVSRDANRDFRTFFNSLEEIIQGGRLGDVGQRLAGDELDLTKQFGGQFQDLAQQLFQRGISNDPTSKALQELGLRQTELATQGLDGLENGGLPSDVRQNILNDVRGRSASQGFLENDNQAVVEAARLAGGREQFRAARLGQAQSILSGVGQSSTLNLPGQRGFSADPLGLLQGGVGGLFGSFSAPSREEQSNRVGVAGNVLGAIF